MCEAMAHEYFELDDEDTMTVLEESPPESDRAKVHAAVEACPVMALTSGGLSSACRCCWAHDVCSQPPSLPGGRSPTATGCCRRLRGSPPSTAGAR